MRLTIQNVLCNEGLLWIDDQFKYNGETVRAYWIASSFYDN